MAGPTSELIDSWVGHGPSTVYLDTAYRFDKYDSMMANSEDTHELKNLIKIIN